MLDDRIDDRVISKADAAKMLGISIDTLDRMNARREGPPRVQLSDRRVGYRISSLRDWISEKTEPATPKQRRKR